SFPTNSRASIILVHGRPGQKTVMSGTGPFFSIRGGNAGLMLDFANPARECQAALHVESSARPCWIRRSRKGDRHVEVRLAQLLGRMTSCGRRDTPGLMRIDRAMNEA